MSTCKKGFWSILGLILISGAALAYMEHQSSPTTITGPTDPIGSLTTFRSDGLVKVGAGLAQSSVLKGSNGRVSMALSLAAVDSPQTGDLPTTPVDLVVVLDRSGSMDGQKIADARNAIIQLLSRLTPEDRLALVTYSNEAQTLSGLLTITTENRALLTRDIRQVTANGGTNLGRGLQQGIDLLRYTGSRKQDRQRKMILISDGLANQGVTDVDSLGRMASVAIEEDFSISSVGVGYEFNEVLMTALADHGSGRYYYLENPQAFAKVFEEECQTARRVAAAALEVRIPQKNGLRLIQAGGYPINYKDGVAIFHPGDLCYSQERRLFLTFEVPTVHIGETAIEALSVRYQHQGISRTMDAGLGLKVACVDNPEEVTTSISEELWSGQVLQEDYSRLKALVADAIRSGEHDVALEKIQAYEAETRALNATVGSSSVTQNLDEELPQLRKKVEETFEGGPTAVETKRKQNAKGLQYDSYQVRRDTKQ